MAVLESWELPGFSQLLINADPFLALELASTFALLLRYSAK